MLQAIMLKLRFFNVFCSTGVQLFVDLGYYCQLKTDYQKYKTSKQEGTNFDLISCYTTKLSF